MKKIATFGLLAVAAAALGCGQNRNYVQHPVCIPAQTSCYSGGASSCCGGGDGYVSSPGIMMNGPTVMPGTALPSPDTYTPAIP